MRKGGIAQKRRHRTKSNHKTSKMQVLACHSQKPISIRTNQGLLILSKSFSLFSIINNRQIFYQRAFSKLKLKQTKKS